MQEPKCFRPSASAYISLSFLPVQPCLSSSIHPAVIFSLFLPSVPAKAHLRHVHSGTSRLLQSRMQLLVLAAAKFVCDEKRTGLNARFLYTLQTVAEFRVAVWKDIVASHDNFL